MTIKPNKIRLICIFKEVGSYEDPWKIAGQDLHTSVNGKFLRIMDGPQVVLDVALSRIAGVQYSEEDDGYRYK